MGSVAGDFALAFNARGGVLVAGGIAPHLLASLRSGVFRARFEAKGRFNGYMSGVASQVITHPYAALLGAAGRVLKIAGNQ
jgi:glucokinase